MDDSILLLNKVLQQAGHAQLSQREHRLIEQLAQRLVRARDKNPLTPEHLSFGDRLADRVAAFGGSWRFILLFLGFLICWVFYNIAAIAYNLFALDPYPFIFLNLILSMIAAFQAPIIMMSQNRQAEKDRLEATNDYEVNLKAELEIMMLHEKVDHLRDVEIIKIQKQLSEMLNQLTLCASSNK